MPAESFKRKLTAILSADVKGYSRLMGENEAETVKTLTSYRKIMAELIHQHRGRVIDSPGDNILAEFGSVVDAVQCSVAAQNEFKARNAELPENRRMEFRIGVNLGDVIEEESRIYGDGVNIAARLEALAEPGGICISKTAFDHIESKLPLGYQFLGEQTVKNIAKPVGAYKVLMEPRVLPVEDKKKAKEVTFWQRKPVLAGAVAVLVVIIGVAVWNFYLRAPKIEPAAKEKMAYPLPDVPSIAVMPFMNMSEDPKQEFLSDGITESIITALSRVPQMFVVARDSTFSYKGKPVKVKQVSEELGVRYVLEGSVQRSTDRIRVTAQLIDALNGLHIWAERYDRKMEDIFALQDEITMKILTATQVKLTGMGTDQAIKADKYFKGKQGLDCYLKFLEAGAIQQRFSIEANKEVRQIGEEVSSMCPDCPAGYYLLALAHNNDYWFGTSKSPRESLDKAIELMQKALAIDDNSGRLHGFLGQIYTMRREYDKGIAEGERAVALDPGGAHVLYYYALSLNFAGRYEEAVTLLQKVIRLNPLGRGSLVDHQLGNALLFAGRYEEAAPVYKRVIQRYPDNLYGHSQLAATYSLMGREQEARAEIAEVLRINPKYSVDFMKKTSALKDRSKIEEIANALSKAGLK
jgi:adenylate cyclase